MPNRPTAKGFPCRPDECYVSRHLEGPEYKIYDLMRAAAPLTNGRRTFYASVRPWLCNAANQAPSTIDATLDRLEASKWIISLGRTRRADGTETPNTYEIVEHEAWAAAHPGCCPDYRFAPNWEEAKKHGVKKGERISTGAMPWNFLKDRDLTTPESVALAAALDKLSDSDREKIREHWKTLVASSGQPEEVLPAPVDRNQLRSTGSGTSSGRPETPAPVDRIDHSRSTGRNPSTPILVNRSQHNTTLLQPATIAGEKTSTAGEEDVCSVLLKLYVKSEGDTPKIVSTKEKQELRRLDREHGREISLRAAALWLHDHPWNNATTNPFLTLVNKFEGYVEQAKLAVKNKRDEASRKIDYEVAGDVAGLRHCLQWSENLFSADELGFVESLERVNWRDHAARIRTLVVDIRKRVQEELDRREAEREKEAQKLQALIDSSDF
jgi:hypothetical protein